MTPRSALIASSIAVAAAAFASPSTAAADPSPTLPAAAAAPVAAAPHELGQSYIFLRVHQDSLIARIEITSADLDRALSLGIADLSGPGDIEPFLAQIREYVEAHLSFSHGGSELPLRYRDVATRFVDVADFVALEYLVEGLEGVPDTLDIRFDVLFEVDDTHRNLVIIEHNWQTSTFDNELVFSLVLSPRSPQQTLDLTSSSVLNGFIGFVRLGVWHIWIGIDHILFLLALVLPSVLMRREGRFEPVDSFRRALINIVTVVTFFTIAHSVTLSVAALGLVDLNSRLVESIIAGSIAVAAWANLMPGLNIREWSIAFVFGLFHGFGFASVLGDIGVGGEYLVLTLLAFNLGVEIGQVAVICLVFPVLYGVRRLRAYPYLLRFGSYLLIAIALYWFAERAFAVDIPIVPPFLRGFL